MRDEPLSHRTTTNPEKACAFRNPACFGVALGRILHEVADRAARTLNAGEAKDPPPRPVGLGEHKSSWNPEQHVVVRATALREFEDPLPTDRNALPRTVVFDALHESRDVRSVPLIVLGIGQRHQQGVDALTTPRKPAASRIRRSNHNSTHPPNPPPLVHPSEAFFEGERITLSCYLSDKPRSHAPTLAQAGYVPQALYG